MLGAEPSSVGVLRQDNDGLWQKIPSVRGEGIILATIAHSGLYRLGEVADVADTALDLVYPNPFNSMSVIRFNLKRRGFARVIVYDDRGAVTAIWDGTSDTGRSVSSGVYFIRVTYPGYNRVRKLTLVR